LLPASLVTITITHVVTFAVAIAATIALVAVARPSPLSPLSCSHLHCPLRRMLPSSPTSSFLSSPSPSLMPTMLISITITLSTLALFVAAIVICCTLSLFVVAHRCGRVVALLVLSCQPLPAFVNPIAG
jgi:hypothetical protein